MFKLLEEAWQITQKYKFLWIFGIFTSHLISYISFNLPFSNLSENFQSYLNLQYLVSSAKLNLDSFINIPLPLLTANIDPADIYSPVWTYPILYTLFFVIFLFGLVLVFLGTISTIGLIWAVNKIRKEELVNFKETFKNSLRYFWRIFCFNLFVLFCFLIAFIPILIFIFSGNIQGFLIYGLLTSPLYLLFFVYLWVFTLIGDREIIINDISLINGIKNTDRIIRSNLKQSIKVCFIYFILEIGLSFLLWFLLSFLKLPILAIILIKDISNILLFILPLFILILGAIFKGIGSTFISTWITLVYLDYFREKSEEITLENQN